MHSIWPRRSSRCAAGSIRPPRAIRGAPFADVDAYVRHLGAVLPEAYLASRDIKRYVETLRKLVAGQITIKDAIKSTPHLARVGGACPCSNSVRWVVEDAA